MNKKDTKAHFDKIYNLTEPFFESEKPTIETNTNSSKPAKKTPSKDTSEVNGDN